MKAFIISCCLIAFRVDRSVAWQSSVGQPIPRSRFQIESIERRAFLISAPLTIAGLTALPPVTNAASTVPDLTFTTSPTGLQYADVKLGSGPTPSPGSIVSIDYVMSTTGARYGSKIYSTVDAGAPYRWKLGDGSTIPGLEEAVSSMSSGGIRRVIIPAKLAYQSKDGVASSATVEECQDGKGLGPRPSITEAVGEFQRFKNIYCEFFMLCSSVCCSYHN